MNDQGTPPSSEPEDPWAAPPQPAPGTSYPAPGNPGPDYGSSTPSPSGSSGYGDSPSYGDSGYSSGSYSSGDTGYGSGTHSSDTGSSYPSSGDHTSGYPASSSGGYASGQPASDTWGSTAQPTAPLGYPTAGAPSPWPPAPAPASRSGGLNVKSGPMLIVAVALAAALVGGGIGGAVAYNAAEGNAGGGPSSLSSPVTSSKADAPVGSVQQVASKVLPSVVSIDVRNASGTMPGFPQGFGGVAGSGSGVVISKDGLILTNAHVAGEGDLSVTFSGGRTVRAELVAMDKQTDLAVIKAKDVNDATPITFGRSGDLTVGQEVVAIGSPLGLSGTVTTGIVSALRRPLLPQAGSGGKGGDEGSVIDGIQTDAPINPGNSGGALVDLNGSLVGITSAIATLGGVLGGQSGSIGLGFAIPIDQARIIAEKLAKGEKVAHALLGVRVRSSDDPTQRGALIDGLTEGGPAEKAGLKKGDIVVKLDDRLIDTSDALVAGVRSRQPGETAKLTYVRGNETKTVDVVLGSDLDNGASS